MPALLRIVGAALAVLVLVAGAAGLAHVTRALVRMSWIALLQWRDLVSLDRWSEVVGTIWRHKLRTLLTTISVAWGIYVLVLLLGLGRGLDEGMRAGFARDATNGVWLSAVKTSIPYNGYPIDRSVTFDNQDFERTRQIAGVEHVAGRFFLPDLGPMSTSWGGKSSTFEILAVHPEAIRLQAHDVIAGRFLNELDIAETRKSAVIGTAVEKFLFGSREPIGQWIVVAGAPFQVVGVFADASGADARSLYIPVSTAQLAFNGSDHLGMLQFTVGDADAAETRSIIDRVIGDLAQRHQFSPSDTRAVRVHTNIEQYQRFQRMFWMISAFVIAIGFGTLAAGVVGVSNIMMISVKERTKEMGVRKALGAKPRSIIFMVIQEAVLITGAAGLLGMSAGLATLELAGDATLGSFIKNPGIDLTVGLAAAAFLIVAGALAGYFPARTAAQANPIHALMDL